MYRPPDERVAPPYYTAMQPSPFPPDYAEPVPRPTGPYGEMKRKLLPQDSYPPEKRIRAPQDFEASDIRDLRLLIEGKARRIAERCTEEGATEMSPELHGYPLSLVKEDFRAMTNRDLDLNKHGGIRLSELISRYAGDVATVVVTQTMAAMVLPCCGKQYGDVFAPAAITPPKPSDPTPRSDAVVKPPGFGLPPHLSDNPAASRANSNSGGGGAGPAARPRPVIAASAPIAPQLLQENPATQLQAAAVKYLQRRILASRFKLNQEAYRSTLAASLKAREPAPAPANGMGVIQALKAARQPGVPFVKKDLIKEINDAAEALAPGLAWPLQSVVPDIYQLAREMSVDVRLVHALDVRALLKAVTEDPLQNPFKLVRRPAAGEQGPGEAGEGGQQQLTLPPDLAGTWVVPILGPHRQLQVLLEVWLCLHSVLPEYGNERNAAMSRALAEENPGASFMSTSYAVEWLPEDYKRQWGKVLSVEALGFHSLAELLQWDLFAPIVRVDVADVQENGGVSRVLIPLFDVHGDLRAILEEIMETALAQVQALKLQQGANLPSGWTEHEALLGMALPSLEDLKLKFKARHLYEPDHFRLGFGSFKGLVEAHIDVCTLDYSQEGPLVVPSSLARLRALLKVVLGRGRPEPDLPQRLAPLAAAVEADGGGGEADDAISIASLEQLYTSVYGQEFSGTAQGYRRTLDALGALADVCSLEGELVVAPQGDLDSQILHKIRIRPPRQFDRFSRGLKPRGGMSAGAHDPGHAAPHITAPAAPGSLGPMRRADPPGVPAGSSWHSMAPPPPPPGAPPKRQGLDMNPEVLAFMMAELAQASAPAPPPPPAAAPALSLDQIVAAALSLGMQLPPGAAAGMMQGAAPAAPPAVLPAGVDSMLLPTSSGHMQQAAYHPGQPAPSSLQQYGSSYASSGAGAGAGTQATPYQSYPPAAYPSAMSNGQPSSSYTYGAAHHAAMPSATAPAAAAADASGYGYGANPGAYAYHQHWQGASQASQHEAWGTQQQQQPQQPQQQSAALDPQQLQQQQRQQSWQALYVARQQQAHALPPGEEGAAAASTLGPRSSSAALPSPSGASATAAAVAAQALTALSTPAAGAAGAAAATAAAPLSYAQQQYQHYLGAGMVQNSMGAATAPSHSAAAASAYQHQHQQPAPPPAYSYLQQGAAAQPSAAQYADPHQYHHQQSQQQQQQQQQQYGYGQSPGHPQQAAAYPHYAYAGAYPGASSAYGPPGAGAGSYATYPPSYPHHPA